MVLRDPAGIAYAVAALATAAIAFVTWRRRAHNPAVAATLTLVMIGGCWWSVGLAIVVASTDETVRAVATLAIPPGPSLMIVSFLCLGYCIARPQWVPRRRLVILLLVEPFLNTLASVTNPWHLLVYGGQGAEQLTNAAHWSYGPIFWADCVYSYLEMAIGLGLVAWGWWKASPAFRGQRRALFLAALVPLVANAVFLAGGFGDIVDPTPFGFAVTGTMMWVAIFRQDLFTFAPVARAMIIDQIGDAVVVISPVGRILDLNPAADMLLRGMNPGAPADLIGAPARDLVGEDATADGRETDVDVELPRGRAEYQVRASLLVDRRRRSLGTVLVARDVTIANAQARRLAAAHSQLVRQIETIEQLRADLVELASRDALTGLHNRRHMVERFASMVATAKLSDAPLAVALLDVDRFKSINDEYGHLAGDAVLVELAHRIQALAPPAALVARWGGEEFFIALPGADAAAGLAFADEVRRQCERDGIEVAGRTLHCTISGGVAAYPASGVAMNELFHSADVSLYEAKNSGRNLVRLHQDRIPNQATEAIAP